MKDLIKAALTTSEQDHLTTQLNNLPDLVHFLRVSLKDNNLIDSNINKKLINIVRELDLIQNCSNILARKRQIKLNKQN